MNQNQKQSRRWCFTLNNYTEEELNEVKGLDLKYVIVGKEVGDSGTPHLQGYVVFNGMKRLAAVNKLLKRAHWEIAKGTTEDNYKYCSKGSEFIEIGDKPKDRKAQAEDQRAKYQDVILHAKAGTLEEHDPVLYWRYYNTAQRIYSDNLKPVGIEKEVYVYWGPTATGKSHQAWKEAGLDAYAKNPRTKWWQGYKQEPHVVIDEFRGGIDIAYLLTWLDKYPVSVEIKGSSLPLSASKIWITSNLHPDFWYPELDMETKDALRRRLRITSFPLPWNSYFGIGNE